MALLRLQNVHRSSRLDVMVINNHLHNVEPPNQLFVPYLQQAGFFPAATLGSFKIDKALVTAMVERWRPETHTFHLPVGECTITLADVAVQLGLRVNGLPVTGGSMFDWESECLQLLGQVPPPTQMKGQCVKIKWLEQTFATIPNGANEVQIQYYCRAYILRLIGGVLMPDKSGNRVHLMYLPLLADLQRAGRYSWGSACLANLYREMCRGCAPAASSMGGCLLLLQSWTWYRMPFIAPQCRRNPSFPLAQRWSDKGLIHTGTPRGDLVGFRTRFEYMTPDQFLWAPYRGYNLPPEAFNDQKIWSATTALICFQMVEWHQTDRVKLQFGLWQEVPGAPKNMDELHNLDMRGQHAENWAERHHYWLQIWRNRRNQVLVGEPIQGFFGHTNEYMAWFRQNSKPYLLNPPQQQYQEGPAEELQGAGTSQQTQRRARRQSSPQVAMEEEEDHLEPQGHTFDQEPAQQSSAFTTFQQQQYQPSFAPSGGDFMSNLFGADVGTPESARLYMERMSNMRGMYTFGVPSGPNQAGPSTSTSHLVDSQDNPPSPLEEPDQPVAPTDQPDQPVAPIDNQRRPRRTRRPTRCGTGGHLGHYF